MPPSPRSTSRSARARRASADDASTRERILDVALQAFAELGFDGASTRTIATRADVNQGLIPYYFGTKEALWREAVGRAFARLDKGVGAAVREAEEASDLDRLALLIRRYVRFVAANPEFVMLMNEEGKRSGKRMRWLVDTHVAPVFNEMGRLYERARREHSVPWRIEAPHFQYIFAGAVGTIFHQAPECRRIFGVDPSDPGVVEAHADALCQLFLGDGSLGRDVDESKSSAPERADSS
jgi:AcrR family transcriptional regulator